MKDLGNLFLMAVIYVIWKFIKSFLKEIENNKRQQIPHEKPRVNYERGRNIFDNRQTLTEKPVRINIESNNKPKAVNKTRENIYTYNMEKIKENEPNQEFNDNNDDYSINVFEITDENIINGIIMKEVLGPPKAIN